MQQLTHLLQQTGLSERGGGEQSKKMTEARSYQSHHIRVALPRTGCEGFVNRCCLIAAIAAFEGILHRLRPSSSGPTAQGPGSGAPLRLFAAVAACCSCCGLLRLAATVAVCCAYGMPQPSGVGAAACYNLLQPLLVVAACCSFLQRWRLAATCGPAAAHIANLLRLSRLLQVLQLIALRAALSASESAQRKAPPSRQIVPSSGKLVPAHPTAPIAAIAAITAYCAARNKNVRKPGPRP